MEYIVAVDALDNEIGPVEKLAAHREAVLHRAVSVIICDANGSMLMQRRADVKYHSAGCWSNSCCGHPRPGETPAHAASRRLAEEMGIATTLRPAGTVSYRIEVSHGLVEHELNHLFIGEYAGSPNPDPREVSAWRWVPSTVAATRPGFELTAWCPLIVASVCTFITAHPELPPAMQRFLAHWQQPVLVPQSPGGS